MFEKNQSTVSGPGTIVGTNVKLTGVLKDANDITIYGDVDGEVISDNNVMIEEKASIKGPVKAKIVTVSGNVNGSIVAETKLEITPTGKITGSIATQDLIIKSGAQLNGKCNMLKEAAGKSETSKTKKEEKPKEETKVEKPKQEKESEKSQTKYELE